MRVSAIGIFLRNLPKNTVVFYLLGCFLELCVWEEYERHITLFPIDTFKKKKGKKFM